ncbi:MAG: hypothetical protein J6Y94_02845, partial [Bacteriovoracaceae bacterium]|nr:hypothetical protein [Bacteriovoracaceae bacterium]
TQIMIREHGSGTKVLFTKQGDVYHNTNGGPQIVRKTKDGFERQDMGGAVEYFNKDGQLVKSRDRNGYELTYNYDAGKLKSLKDSHSKQLFFEWYASGLVKSITGPDRKPASYTYENERLVKTKDVADNVYTYDYDGNFNLVSVTYKDNTKLQIKYDPKTQFVQEIAYPSGQVKKYSYGANPANPDNDYWTSVTEKGLDGKERTSKYAYLLGKKVDGGSFTKKLVTEINGQRTETEYSDRNELPLKIVRGKQVTTFTYNDRNLLTSKNSNGEVTKLEYHPTFNKITKVTDATGVTEYQYDKKGNLTEAKNAEQKLQLVYDSRGRITKLIDVSKTGNKGKKLNRSLEFTYNSLGRPVVIKMDKVGQINVSYNNNGDVNSVDSKKGGPAVAAEISKTFQSLLAMVRPAGVDLSI